MKYFSFLFLSVLLLTNCTEPTTTTSEAVQEAAAEAGEKAEKVIQADATQTKEKTIPAEAAAPESDENIIRGTYMYYADADVFVECGTGEKYLVSGKAHLDLQERYLKMRTKDFQNIYMEVEGSFGMSKNMEGTEKKTLMVDKLVSVNPEKNCN